MKKILSLAQKQIGIKEYPANSNRVLYNTEYYGRQVTGSAYPWCCVFQWWLFKHAGMSDLFYGGGKTASCSTLYSYHRKKGQAVYGEFQPGDVIFFDFSGKQKKTEHVGLCESFDGKYITTIDGNTGTKSEANGGGVMRRRRPVKFVSAAYRPKYEVQTMTVDEAKRIVQKKAGLNDDTMFFLSLYKWGDDLLLKLAKGMKE